VIVSDTAMGTAGEAREAAMRTAGETFDAATKAARKGMS